MVAIVCGTKGPSGHSQIAIAPAHLGDSPAAFSPVTVRCELNGDAYQKSLKVSDAEMAAINISRNEFHGAWNYTISPNTRSDDWA